MANLLANETSPYLLRHKDNPVHWRPWGPQALAEAERSAKPIFLSIGYAGCRPCEVMAKETFADADVAALLNENFVCILVDRFERPDVDALYQAAAQAMRSPGGWPMNLFMTAKAEPIGSGNFFPKDDLPQQGVMGFRTAANNVLTMLRGTDPQIENTVSALRQGLTALWETDRRLGGQLSPFALEQAARRTCQLQDVFSGGINGIPKFPNIPVVEMLWRAHQRTGAAQFGTAVEIQLVQMSLSGIYDHVGGGYARLAQDEFWIVPQFEKALSDNAQLIEILATVWQSSRQPLYKTRIEETVAWLQRVMLQPSGAFAATVGSSVGDVEGAHVTWTAAEIDEALGGEDAKVFKQIYDVREGGNWQGKSILHRLAFPQVDPVIEGRLNGMRQKLLEYRTKRVAPEIDTTILADANGMLVRALTIAAETFNRIEWQAMAVRAFWFVAEKMSSGRKLSHSMRSGVASSHDFPEDYVQMAAAALTLFETTGDARYLEKAQDWFSELDQRFWLPAVGGYASTPSDGEKLFARPRISLDGFVPAANGVAGRVAAQLFFLTGQTHYRDRANEILAAFAPDALGNTAMHASVFNALDSVIRALQVVIIGERQSPDVVAFRDVLRRVSLPNKIVQIVASADALPASHPAFGKPKVQGRATAYLANATQCSPPLVDANQFEMALKTRTTTVPLAR
jgi:uncharacterized protein